MVYKVTYEWHADCTLEPSTVRPSKGIQLGWVVVSAPVCSCTMVACSLGPRYAKQWHLVLIEPPPKLGNGPGPKLMKQS